MGIAHLILISKFQAVKVRPKAATLSATLRETDLQHLTSLTVVVLLAVGIRQASPRPLAAPPHRRVGWDRNNHPAPGHPPFELGPNISLRCLQQTPLGHSLLVRLHLPAQEHPDVRRAAAYCTTTGPPPSHAIAGTPFLSLHLSLSLSLNL